MYHPTGWEHHPVGTPRRKAWPVGQVVKTAASHAFNIGSNPVRVTIFLLTESGKVNIMVVTAKAAAI